jgi:uncharacterized membrane protein
MTSSDDRWVREGAAAGQDSRDIDAEMQDPDAVAAKQKSRAVTHADEAHDRPPEEQMGTTSTTRDPAPRD